MTSFPILLYNTNHTMTFTQNLFRRHTATNGRNRGGDGEAENASSVVVGEGTSDAANVDGGESSSTIDDDGILTSTARNNTALSSNINGDDEEQELVVQIPNISNTNNAAATATTLPFFQTWTPSEQDTSLRRQAIHREVERVQRANFIHFALLCLVPTSLLLIVIAAIVSEDGECSAESSGGGGGGDDGGYLTLCEREARTFVNAFTTRCICDAVRSVAWEDEEGVVVDDPVDSGGV